jgi:hypothetical protein
MMQPYSKVISLLVFALSLCGQIATAQTGTNYVASVIEFGESFQSVVVADINGDQRNDLIVSNWNENQGRELWLYWQQADGKFPAKASRRIEIKRDIVAYALADVRPEPGDELLFFTAASIFSYSTTHDSYANNLHKLLDWTFVSAVPSRRSTLFLGNFSDHDGDGRIDLLIPGQETYGLLKVSKAGSDDRAPTLVELPKAEQSMQDADAEGGIDISMQNGFTIEVVRPSNFKDLVVERLGKKDPEASEKEESQFSRYSEPGTLLFLEQWIQNVQLAQLAADPGLEAIFVDEDPKTDHKKGKKQRVNIVSFSNQSKTAIAYQGELDERDQLKLFDFNDDGLMDLLATRVLGSDDVTANFYLNQGGKFDLGKADHVVKFSGYDVNFRLSDINGDGRSDLILGAYNISALDALRDGALVRLSLIYSGNPNFKAGSDQPLFSRRPDFKLEENFSADDIKGLTEPVDFTQDINGDGKKDAVAIDKRGALTAKTLDQQFRLQNTAFWDFVPLHFIQQVESHRLNQDQRPDFILRHQSAVTVLVSRN